MKIMVCHDGSRKAQDALNKTIELFKAQKPEFILIAVVEEPLDATSTNEESYRKWCNSREDDLKKAAGSVVRQGLEVDVILATGDPRKMLLVRHQRPNHLICLLWQNAAVVFWKKWCSEV